MPAPLPLSPDPFPDLLLVARTLWAEARSDGEPGMTAVAWVVKNRWQHPTLWGESPKEVVLQPAHFSCWNSNDPQRARLEQLTWEDTHYRLAFGLTWKVLMGLTQDDPTYGSDHYLNPQAVPHWPGRPGQDWWAGREAQHMVSIGRHRFWKLGGGEDA